MALRHRTEITLLGIVAGSAIAAFTPGARLEIFIGICLFALLVSVIPSRGALKPASSNGGWYSSYFDSRLTPSWVRGLAIAFEVGIVIALIIVWLVVF